MNTPNLADTGLLGGRRVVLFCSFCGAGQHQVAYLITGKNVGICDGCVDDCNGMVARWREKNGKVEKGASDALP